MINLVNSLKQLVGYVPIIIGIYFLLSTAVAMIRFPDLYTRLHASSKCLLAGSTSILLGCIILEGINYASLKLVVLLVFLIITNPIAVHVIANFAYKENIVPKINTSNKHD